jgi:hypothetical protein
VPLPRRLDPGLWLAALRSRKAARRALARLEALFASGAGPEAVALEFGLDRIRLGALDRLASAPDGWRPIPAIIPETGRRGATRAAVALCRSGLAHASPARDSLWLSDAGRYILILCSAEGRPPLERLPPVPVTEGA